MLVSIFAFVIDDDDDDDDNNEDDYKLVME